MCASDSVPDVCLQLPIRTGLHTTQSIQNVEQNKECLIQVSRHKFPLVINGLTKTLQSVDSMVSVYHSVVTVRHSDSYFEVKCRIVVNVECTTFLVVFHLSITFVD